MTVPSTFGVALPNVGCWVMTTEAGLTAPSASVSFAATGMFVAAPCSTVALSFVATGARFGAPATVIVTLVPLLTAVPSLAWYLKVSVPVNEAFGV
nr:hypothetical protein [Mycobacterium sp. E740]